MAVAPPSRELVTLLKLSLGTFAFPYKWSPLPPERPRLPGQYETHAPSRELGLRMHGGLFVVPGISIV